MTWGLALIAISIAVLALMAICAMVVTVILVLRLIRIEKMVMTELAAIRGEVTSVATEIRGAAKKASNTMDRLGMGAQVAAAALGAATKFVSARKQTEKGGNRAIPFPWTQVLMAVGWRLLDGRGRGKSKKQPPSASM